MSYIGLHKGIFFWKDRNRLVGEQEVRAGGRPSRPLSHPVVSLGGNEQPRR